MDDLGRSNRLELRHAVFYRLASLLPGFRRLSSSDLARKRLCASAPTTLRASCGAAIFLQASANAA